MRIYIVGTGGIGGYFGGLMAKGGLDVTFIARGENFEAIREKGLLIKSVEGDFWVKDAKVIETISEIENPDLILFSVKTYDTEKVAKELALVVTDNTILLTFQNGVENDFQIQKLIGRGYVYPGVAYVITAKNKPGIVEQTGGLRKIIFGDRDNPGNPRLLKVEELMRSAGVDATCSNDIVKDIWMKFLFICPFSGITALHGKTIGEILLNPDTKKQYEECLKEGIAVAKAKQVLISDDVFTEIMNISEKTTPGAKSSLLLDIENKRRNEIETLNGSLVRFAKELKIDVPVNELVYEAIK